MFVPICLYPAPNRHCELVSVSVVLCDEAFGLGLMHFSDSVLVARGDLYPLCIMCRSFDASFQFLAGLFCLVIVSRRRKLCSLYLEWHD